MLKDVLKGGAAVATAALLICLGLLVLLMQRTTS